MRTSTMHIVRILYDKKLVRIYLILDSSLRHHYIGYIIQGFNRLVYVVCMPFLFDD